MQKIMHILVIGGGAREHAIAAALKRSPQSPLVFCCGSSLNPGLLALSEDYWVGDLTDIAVIAKLATTWQIELAIIGPEQPLEKGLADALWKLNIATIGPKKQLAQIETSKTFARDLMQKYNIAGLPRYQTFSDLTGVLPFLTSLGESNYVIKADGLMGGKGVKVAGEHLHSFEAALGFCKEIIAVQQTFVIEEKLIGQEFSYMCFCDGYDLVHMPIVQDHKRAYNDDVGPNTGGMGSYSAANHSLPFLNEIEVEQAANINSAIIAALSQEFQDKYIGILYGSFIVTARGVFVIEFNARFGDPEALNVLTLLTTDFVAICQALVSGQLARLPISFLPQASVCKYAVPTGYPHAPVKNTLIDINGVKNKSQLYLGAVQAIDDKIFATGSRTVAAVGIADTIAAAEAIAEKEICAVKGSLFHREDIGTEKSIAKRISHMLNLRSSSCA